ncbi:MAG: gfo/Idh/MocA family oxidoreductase [Mongoliibacter sp.]|uniref:Gfo/Idh/MocA family protein n=1 Tax=Mongoliibacter sp. TaxID=2022438 RepID=UPI0012F42926|nr:Gfo/Idh/MocA family oxidoreductase [Mongoliibacter sp.]TVP45840.1 MAG: gfo/Idh/MocA family oxidoreductase [Mongoliibacter sp.]
MRTRREFIQNLTVGAGILPFAMSADAFGMPSPAPYFPQVQDGPVLKVALMGLGSYADRVAKAMQDCKRAKITGLISGTPSKLQSWGKTYNVPEGSRYNYENFDEIKNNPEIDAVYIITPNALHHGQCLRVAAAGKHVICEKPMSINAQEGKEMVEACAKAGVKLLIGYRMHFEANTLNAVKMREEGELGEIKFFQGLSGFIIGDPTQWRLDKDLAGGGAMMDIGIYAINGARYMIGEEPIWVTAQEVKTDPIKFKEGVDETITFQMGFPSGAIASCLSTYSMNYLDKFFLNGDKGFVEMQPSTGYGPIKSWSHKGEINKPHVTHQTVQMDQMASIIFDGKVPEIPVDGEEGLKDMKIIDAIMLAVKSGQKVKLDMG